MPELAYVNGVVCPIDKAVVSIDDRGFQFGDGVYEVIFAYKRKLFLFDQHVKRLAKVVGATGSKTDGSEVDLG